MNKIDLLFWSYCKVFLVLENVRVVYGVFLLFSIKVKLLV